MTGSFGKLTAAEILEILAMLKAGKLTPPFPLFEYREIESERHHKAFESHLYSMLKTETFFVSCNVAPDLKNWLLVQVSEFDSSIFGFKMATITDVLVTDSAKEQLPELIMGLRQCAAQNHISHLSLSLNANCNNTTPLFQAFIVNGFYFISTLLSFSCAARTFHDLDLSFRSDPDVKIRQARESDYEPLFRIARDSYKNDRFHLDPNLPSDKCDLLFTRSLENSIFHHYVDAVFVAEYAGEVCGYYTAKVRVDTDLGLRIGNVLFTAVSTEIRNRGVFQALHNTGLKWFNDNSDIAEIGTYINNQPIHTVCIKNRMKLIRGSYQLGCYFG